MSLSWLLLPLLAIAVDGQAERATTPANPCPAVFQYNWNSRVGWHGIITIIPPSRFSEVQLTVRESLPYHNPGAGVGRVEVKGGDAAIQEISRRAIRGESQTIQYILIFPPFKDIPRVTAVIFNGKDFCPTQQVYADTRARIELKYSLKSGLNIPVSPGQAFSVSTATQPTQTDFLVVGIAPEEARPIEPPFHQGHQPTNNNNPSIEVFVIEITPNKPQQPFNNNPSVSNVGNNINQHVHNQKPFNGNNNEFSNRPQKPLTNQNEPFLGNGMEPLHVDNNQQFSGTSTGNDKNRPENVSTSRPTGSNQQNRPKPVDNTQHFTGSNRPTGSNQQNRPKPVDNTQQHRPIPGDNEDVSAIHFPNTDYEQMNLSSLDERVLQLLKAISSGKTVASQRVELLLIKLIDLTRKRLELEHTRLLIEQERLHLEASLV